jgi:hypothetical protein
MIDGGNEIVFCVSCEPVTDASSPNLRCGCPNKYQIVPVAITSKVRLSRKIRIFSRPMKGVWIQKHAIDPHRVRDVLNFAIPKRLIPTNEFVLYQFVHAARDANLVRPGNSRKT